GGEGSGGRPPPFRFILSDSDYRVVMGAGVYENGEPLPESARHGLLPVKVGGEVRAYVSTEGVLSPGPDDLAYMDTMRQALWWGVGVAALLALALGALLGEGLSARLRRLTVAVQAMRAGDLRQRVAIAGRDEVALLGQAFNAMSEQLASSHESLETSNATILAQAEQMKELSIRDALTGLYNRRHFDEAVQQLYRQAVRHGRPLSVVVSDIDWFKKINDGFSHAVGDTVLRQVAEILTAQLRASDLLARYGGEEFVIALPETGKPAAAALCDKLRAAIAHFPWSEIAPGLNVTMSFGVSAEMAEGSPEAMLNGADTQLYRAKESGRNQVCLA
ncbi:GGDEF domain-containing protein, partial [Pelomonas sp. KK5]|uniref:GGDEF domain-containing protein n=1 Tax=Pelomonas sp. KK5 TaxID=1855730 RepID=UPI0009F9A745